MDFGLGTLGIARTSALFQTFGRKPRAIEAWNIEDMGSLRIGAQVLRSQLGISSGPVDFCVLIWDSSYSTCWDVMVNSSGTKRIGKAEWNIFRNFAERFSDCVS